LSLGSTKGTTEAHGEFWDATLIAPVTQQAECRYGLFQDAGINGSPMSKAERVQDNAYYDSVPHIAQQGRSHIRRLGTQEGSQTIRMNLSEPRRSRVLEPIIRGYAFGLNMESERVVQVGQLQVGLGVLFRWREAVCRRYVAKQLPEVPVESGGEREVPKPDLSGSVIVCLVGFKEVCEWLVV
jgi:hypothetical protein